MTNDTEKNETSRRWGFAQVVSSLILGFMCLMGVVLSLDGLWIIGAPIALVTGVMLLRTLLGWTRWKGGGDGPRDIETPSSKDI